MLAMGATGTMEAATNPTAGPSPRLVRAAHEFEALMIKELLKPMTRGDGLSGGENDSDAGSGGVLGEFASESLAGALSAQGGLGIAKRIVHDLSHFGKPSPNRQGRENLVANTRIRHSE